MALPFSVSAGNHGTVVELLEIPQLMDTCIRNGNYDDALDLKGFIGKLAFMHSDLQVVQVFGLPVTLQHCVTVEDHCYTIH